MKTTETAKETLERLARNARKGTVAAKRFATMVKRVAKTPSPASKAKETEPKEA